MLLTSPDARILVQGISNEMQNAIIDETVLRLLACPACHAGLALLNKEDGEAEKAVLCTGCARRYPIRDGLPVLLVPAAPQ